MKYRMQNIPTITGKLTQIMTDTLVGCRNATDDSPFLQTTAGVVRKSRLIEYEISVTKCVEVHFTLFIFLYQVSHVPYNFAEYRFYISSGYRNSEGPYHMWTICSQLSRNNIGMLPKSTSVTLKRRSITNIISNTGKRISRRILRHVGKRSMTEHRARLIWEKS